MNIQIIPFKYYMLENCKLLLNNINKTGSNEHLYTIIYRMCVCVCVFYKVNLSICLFALECLFSLSQYEDAHLQYLSVFDVLKRGKILYIFFYIVS